MVQQASHQQYVNHAANKAPSSVVGQVAAFFCGRSVSVPPEGSPTAPGSVPSLQRPQPQRTTPGADRVFYEKDIREFKASADFDQVSWT